MTIHQPCLLARACIALACIPLPLLATETVFFDNTDTTSGGVLTADSENWYASMFTSENTDTASLTATLLLAESAAGVAQLDLYSDEDGFVPDQFIASFESPANYGEAVSATDFTLSSVDLVADTNYWLVLRSESGSYDWSFREDWETDDDLHPWAESIDAGDLWFPNDVFPFRFRVASSDEVGVTCSPINDLDGDLDGNGAVEFADFLVFSANFGNATSSYSDGDIDCNGTVEFADFLTLSANFGQTLGATVAEVPEPASFTLLPIALVCLSGCRRRRG